MKLHPRLPHIDPAFLYLSGFFVFVGVLVIIGNSFVQDPGPAFHPHRQFPTENDVNSSVRIGETRGDILSEYGQPSELGPLQDGLEVLDYYKPSATEPPDDTSAYAGFSVYLRDDKVVAVNIIRGSDLRKH
jgi:hypothetical protein